MRTGTLIFLKGWIFISLSMIMACTSQKDTVASRGMQNLTARYNVLYNARILIDESERNISAAHRDDYSRLIPVFEEPTDEVSQLESKNLDKAIEKLQVIISEKSRSQYVDDAYFLIAKSNYLKSQFFNAAEFFDYRYKAYPDDNDKRVETLTWKARSLIALSRFEEAEGALDSALRSVAEKSRLAATVFATRAQLHIHAREDAAAIALLEKAIKRSPDKHLKSRWTFLLAQLQELNGRKDVAYGLYTSVMKSNAAFALAFNARLNRISLSKESGNGTRSEQTEELRALLKDDKNKQFSDQIYFEIGNAYLEKNDIENAVANFNLSVRSSRENSDQKGLSYLSLADLYFKQSLYAVAKNYYDSTLLALPKTHPDYARIFKKASNLDLLTSQLAIISKEDTLQMLANLPEAERQVRIERMVAAYSTGASATGTGNDANSALVIANGYNLSTDGKFYFNNTAALSQGYSDFKSRWGNRKLEDNWRTSQRSAAQVTNNVNLAPPSPDEASVPPVQSKLPVRSESDLRQEYLKNVPLTPAMLETSNSRISQAYLEIAGFYRDIIGDKLQAISTYEALLKRFPISIHTTATYYNLFRLYSDTDAKKAEHYKQLILTNFPDSPFAKVLLDPQYGQRLSEKEAALHQAYNQIYELYLDKKYGEVLSQIKTLQQLYPKNMLSAQLSYLSALATGHLQKLPLFEEALRTIDSEFPADNLVAPLVRQHLAYIDQNREKIARREFALLDHDESEPRWVEEPENQPTVADVAPLNGNKVEPVPTGVASNVTTLPPASTFTSPDSNHYYFVVNVQDPSANLSSSRFGIGQFNRTQYASATIKHQLKRVNNQNQLIFVGLFNSKSDAEGYYQNIMPLMSQIMKVPAGRYSTFIISQENFDKLVDKEALEKYIEFYQNTFK